MKTIVSLALAGLMSISALLPTLAAQEAESVSIAESSSISESMAQDESSVSSSGSTADESTAPESGSNAGADVSQPESDSMPVKSDGSTSDGSEAETSSSLPVSDSMASDEMDADSEPASGSETAESDVDAKDEDSSGVTAATADEQSVSVTVSEECCGRVQCGKYGNDAGGHSCCRTGGRPDYSANNAHHSKIRRYGTVCVNGTGACSSKPGGCLNPFGSRQQL